MDCLIIAGGIPTPDDPIYPYSQGKPKALIDMNGRSMLERVMDAVQEARQIDDIVVIGLGDDMGMRFKRPVSHLPDHGSMLRNVVAGLQWYLQKKPDTALLLIVSADIPALTAEIVDQFIVSCRPFDHGLYYNFVTKETMEKRFPDSNRTFVKLKGMQVAGGDMLMVNAQVVLTNQELAEALTNARKHAWKLARTAGLGVMLKLLTRQLSLDEISRVATRIIGRPAKAIVSPFAEIAMDADKPHQVDLLRKEFRR